MEKMATISGAIKKHQNKPVLHNNSRLSVIFSMKDTVSKKGENYKVDRRPHARLYSTLGANTVVHHLVPVLSGKDL